MRDGETRGRKETLTFGQIVNCLRRIGDEANEANIERVADELSKTPNRIRQVF